MQLTSISVRAGVSYLLNTVAAGDTNRGVGGALDYFNQPGNAPGVWLGAGLAGLNIAPNTTATVVEAKILFSQLRHPRTQAQLGNAVSDRPYLDGKGVEREPLAGFDLTFRIPKSISVIWGVADRELQRQIEAVHDEAVADTLAWLEANVIATRSGSGGVATVATKGLVAIGFKHYETRDGDPHLHTHVAVANRVQRASDGKWLTVDSRALHKWAVTASEVHENLLLDHLRDKLGLRFAERPDVAARQTRAVVADVVGVPGKLVNQFSQRRLRLTARAAELLADWRGRHEGEPPRKVIDAVNNQAWRETRRPKDAVVASLSDLTTRWRSQLSSMGWSPQSLRDAVLGNPEPTVDVAAVVGDDPTTTLLARAVAQSWAIFGNGASTSTVADVDVENYVEDDDIARDTVLDDAAVFVHANLSRSAATWTAANARNEAERLTRLIPCRPGERESLTSAIAERAIALCVPVTPTRYRLPVEAINDPRLSFGAGVVFDQPTLALFTSREVIDAEAFLNDLADRPTNCVAAEHLATTALGEDLSPDQAQVASWAVTNPAVLSAVIGPAGSGKTRTMRAVRTAWEARHGPGKVMGVAPSAVAAAELADALGIGTKTVAALVTANSPVARGARREWRETLRARFEASQHAGQRAAILRQLAKAEAEEASVTLRPDTLLIVDEASMVSTHDLAALGRLAVEAGARVLAVGDPAQLDSPEAGGVLGWLDRQGKARHLSTLWRFADPAEATATELLRAGDISAFHGPSEADAGGFYHRAGRVHSAPTDDALDGAFEAVRSAQRAGRDAVLIAATNEHVTDLNLRTTLERRATGEVDASRLVSVRGALTAGIGDVICARKNDRRLRDSTGAPIYNGNLLTVVAIAANGDVTAAHLDDAGRTITLPAKYLSEHVDLGYALTAHRAQGVTVDEAHLAIPYGAPLTRELLYVAMTRGRTENHVWVGLPDEDELAHEHRQAWRLGPDGKLVDNRPTALGILGQKLAAVGAERTAHEQAAAEHAERQHLGRLVAEHEVLGGYAVSDNLRAFLAEHHGELLTAQMTRSVAWDSLVTMFRRAYATNPERALRLLRIPLLRDLDPQQDVLPGMAEEMEPYATQSNAMRSLPDPAKVAHARLRDALDRPAPCRVDDDAWIGGLVVPISTSDSALADLAAQNERLIAQRVADLRAEVSASVPPYWVGGLPPCPKLAEPPEAHDRWLTVATACAIYRDRWQVTGQAALGPTLDDEADHTAQGHHRRQVSDLVQTLQAGQPTRLPNLAREPEFDPFADPDFEWNPPEFVSTDVAQDWVALDDQADLVAVVDPEPAFEIEDFVVPSWRDHLKPAAPVAPERLHELAAVNAAAWKYWQRACSAPNSWVPGYLHDRGLNKSLTPAHAPPGWRTTLEHLRRVGFTEDQVVDAGLAKQSSTGRLIDVFRDRLPVPIYDRYGRIAGFSARANPAEMSRRPDTPKYLNTPTTDLYAKSRLLAGLDAQAQERLRWGWTPVLCEGPLDVAAVKASGALNVVPLAPCGTALTADQLALIESVGGNLDSVTIAFDQDDAGRAAAARVHDLLGPDVAAYARVARWDDAKDPGVLIEHNRHDDLANALSPWQTQPLAVAYVEHLVATTAPATEAECRRVVEAVGAQLCGPGQSNHEVAAARAALTRLLPEVEEEEIAFHLPADIGAPPISGTAREAHPMHPAPESPAHADLAA